VAAERGRADEKVAGRASRGEGKAVDRHIAEKAWQQKEIE
jgi:hypothetical protein